MDGWTSDEALVQVESGNPSFQKGCIAPFFFPWKNIAAADFATLNEEMKKESICFCFIFRGKKPPTRKWPETNGCPKMMAAHLLSPASTMAMLGMSNVGVSEDFPPSKVIAQQKSSGCLCHPRHRVSQCQGYPRVRVLVFHLKACPGVVNKKGSSNIQWN